MDSSISSSTCNELSEPPYQLQGSNLLYRMRESKLFIFFFVLSILNSNINVSTVIYNDFLEVFY